MQTIQTVFIFFIALEHLYFLLLEMFLWTSPKGIKTFGLKSKEFAYETRVLAANQGLYNGFLALGLMYAWLIDANQFILFFLACIIVAGIYGAYSTKKLKLFYIQSVPAIILVILLGF